MAVSRPGLQLPLVAVCFLFIGILHNVLGTGTIRVHFIRYSDSCKEMLGLNSCDPMFSFCLSTPQYPSLTVDTCNYASTGESRDYFQDTNHIEMEHLATIKGLANPWVVSVPKFQDPSVMLVVRMRDHDYLKRTHKQTWGITLTETIWPTEAQSVWVEKSMSQEATRWQGPWCNNDINECSLGYCVRGGCTNLPGDYTCNCPPNYTGKNCSQMLNPCRTQPCKNGGHCFAHTSEHSYVCKCSEEWQGNNCETLRDLCQPNPCQNSGSCVSSPDMTSYNCSCVYPFTGSSCQVYSSTSASTSLKTTPTETLVTTVTTQPSTARTIMGDGLETSSSATVSTTLAPQPSPTRSIMRDESSTQPSDIPDANMQQLTQKDDDNNFQPWYVAIIFAALVVVIIVLAILFIKRRRYKTSRETMQKGLTVSYVATENEAYSYTNRNNSEMERQTRQLPPVPDFSINGALFNPVKPTCAQVNETEGATGRCKDDDSDLKKKSAETLVKAGNPTIGTLTHPVNMRAQTNPYADFKSLRDSTVEVNDPEKDNHHEESHYHDLDDIAASVLQSNKADEKSNEPFNYNIQDTPVVAVGSFPYNIPSNNSSIYATPRRTSNAFNFNEDATKENELTESGNFANNFNPSKELTSADLSNDSSDDDNLQEDLAQLRKAVVNNLMT